MRHRPIGIGVQGLADAFILMRYPFESPEAKELNKQIFETLYYAALTVSVICFYLLCNAGNITTEDISTYGWFDGCNLQIQ